MWKAIRLSPGGILLIGLILGALMAFLIWIGFCIAAGIKGGGCRIHFVMQEDGIGLVWPDRPKDVFDTGRKALAVAGAAVGSRAVRGRRRPAPDEVSDAAFSQVIRFKSCPKWNMIDLYMLGGKFQVYANSEDYAFVEQYIPDRVPERLRKAHR